MGNRGKKYLMETTTQQLEDAVGSKVKITQRKPSDKGLNDGRNSHVQRHCNLPPATFGGFFEYGEVHFESSSRNRVPWGSNNFFKDVSVFTTREFVKNPESMS